MGLNLFQSVVMGIPHVFLLEILLVHQQQFPILLSQKIYAIHIPVLLFFLDEWHGATKIVKCRLLFVTGSYTVISFLKECPLSDPRCYTNYLEK